MLLPSINSRMLPTALGRRFFLHNFQFSDRYKCSFTDCCTPPRLCQRLLRASTRSHWTRANLSPMRWPCSRTTSASTSPSTPSTPASWRTRWDTRSGRRKAAPSSPISFSWRTFSLESITSLLHISWRWQLVFFTFLDVDIGAHCPGLWRAHGLKCFSARLSSSDNTTRSGALQYIGYTLVWMHVKFWRFAGLLPWSREAYSHRRWKIFLFSKCMIFWFRCTFLLVTQRRCCPSG